MTIKTKKFACFSRKKVSYSELVNSRIKSSEYIKCSLPYSFCRAWHTGQWILFLHIHFYIVNETSAVVSATRNRAQNTRIIYECPRTTRVLSLKTYQCSVLRILMAWSSQRFVLRSNLMDDARATKLPTIEESQCAAETIFVFLWPRRRSVVTKYSSLSPNLSSQLVFLLVFDLSSQSLPSSWCMFFLLSPKYSFNPIYSSDSFCL